MRFLEEVIATNTEAPMRIAEAARMLGVTERTVLRFIKRGELPAHGYQAGKATRYTLQRSDVAALAQRRGISIAG